MRDCENIVAREPGAGNTVHYNCGVIFLFIYYVIAILNLRVARTIWR